jgi:hypothetical protein
MDVTVRNSVASPPAGSSSGSHTRIYGPRNFEDEFRMTKN